VLVCDSIEDRAVYQVTPKLLLVYPVRVWRKSITPSQQRTSTGLRLHWSVRVAGGPRRCLADSGISASGRIKPEGPFTCGYFTASACAIKDTATSAAGTVRLPPAVIPVSGAAGTVRAIARASLQAPAGHAC
jgi:hypothetical protein